MAGLRSRWAGTHPDDLETLRTLLIQVGQLEQAVEDGGFNDSDGNRQLKRRVTQLTDRVARAFCCLWAEANQTSLELGERPRHLLAGLKEELESIDADDDALLPVRIPEGFEFYTLYPEQYCESAMTWARAHAGTWPKRALVVGIRSIGTTLSAVVAATLKSAGWRVERLTVRPTGHPFHRQVTLEWLNGGLPTVRQSGAGGEAKCALVVDEGPGLSGSSMAAAADALERAGFADISLLPGHGGEPGAAANSEVRRCWARLPRYWTELEALHWNGCSLTESLLARAEAQWDAGAGLVAEGWSVDDLSGGAWRGRVYAGETEWPAVVAGFERTKVRCLSPDGAGVVWKFAGLGCAWEQGQTAAERALAEMDARAQEGLVAAPLACFRGFVAVPWLGGERLRREEAQDAAVLGRVGQYLARCGGPELGAAEAQAAVSRLEEMVYVNVQEALGEAFAERTRSWREAVRGAPMVSYGDGRLAPHEWVRTAEGRILKTDCTGHDRDHSLVGRQSVLWDVAGAIVEWGLEPDAADALLRSVCRAGIRVDEEALKFYQIAYAAFRLGLSTLGAGQVAAGTAEERRLQRAAERYGGVLRGLL